MKDLRTKEVIIKDNQHNEIYKVDEAVDPSSSVWLSTLKKDIRICHRRLGHSSMRLGKKLYKRDLVAGLPKAKAYLDEVCQDCLKGKQHRVSFKSKKVISKSKPLELVHIVLWTYAVQVPQSQWTRTGYY